ncbi:MAG TPA: YkgJ family cysteine cluster protein [Phycisphaerae bacterium]|nr:YkgJ family cysteine cluster protein [Phycisphaerae bacterium]
MQLPLLQTNDRFSCGSCTHCCDQPWRTMIEADKAKALHAHDFSKYPQLAGRQFYSPAADGRDGFYDLAKGEGTRCLFLDADGLCIIHKELGAEAKPAMCRQFPFLPSRTWTDDRLAMNFGCPSVQANQGEPLTRQSADIASILPASSKPHKGAGAGIPFDTASTLTHEEYDAVCDHALTLFDEARAADIWTRFAELLSTLAALQEGLRKSPNGVIDDRSVSKIMTDASAAPSSIRVEAFASPPAAPMAARMLFAATLHPDTLSAGQTGRDGLFLRMSRIPRLMALAQLSGAYASRVLARNVAIDDVLAHPVRSELEPAATRLLARYFRSRFWARLLVGTRLPIVAGVHQHIHDFNAIVFLARAEAHHRGQTLLSEPLIREALARVEFHIANQSRLYEQTMRGWLKSRLCDVRLAQKSLGLMAVHKSAKIDAALATVS